MRLFARLMYRALVWKERQRARQGRRAIESSAPGISRLESQTPRQAAHLETGKRGETLAYWYLRRAGYTMVARNRRSTSGGELDLVGWDASVLAFIEVKTRSSLEAGPPEAAVLPEQRKRIVRGARDYLRRLKRKDVTYRFDIVSVLWDPEEGYKVRLIKDAFKEQ
ncbi:MAG TPA: YraN family protein [Terriglobia bacterium]|nr:YraN family protein [Terriglobia bacterium]